MVARGWLPSIPIRVSREATHAPPCLAEFIDIEPVHTHLVQEELHLIEQKRVLVVPNSWINCQRRLWLRSHVELKRQIALCISLYAVLPGQVGVINDLGLFLIQC